jgi:NADH dehydrogenase
MPAKVVILGGGFGGVAAGKALAHSSLETTLINRSSFHVYHASLYEAATEEVTRETVMIPLHQIFGGTKVQVVRDEVLKVDKAKRRVHLTSGDKYDYDYLVLALGAVSNDFGIPGVKEHSFMFRELHETLLLRDNLRTSFHMADERSSDCVNVVICGGGFSGVELAAELRWHLTKLQKEYHLKRVGIGILEASPQILPGMPEPVIKLAKKRLRDLEIDLLMGDPVAEVRHDGVRLKSGKWIPSDLTVWTAGTKPNPIPSQMQLPLDEKGRPAVSETLQAINNPEIFIVGDIAGYINPQTQHPIPPQAYNAQAMGRVAGQNILRLVNKLSPKAFRPEFPSFIIPIGHNDALLVKGSSVNEGEWPSFLKRLVELRYLMSLFGVLRAWPIFWNEVRVMAD